MAIAAMIRKSKKRSVATTVFIIVMLAYPLFRFAVTWLYINPNALITSFMRQNSAGQYGVMPGDFFINFKLVWMQITTDAYYQGMLLNSFVYLPVTCLVSLPLSAIFAYFLCKKMPGQNLFRIIFYLPSIIPVAVLTMTFRFAFSDHGFAYELLRMIGINPPAGGYFGPNTAQLMVFVYCVWAGLGFNIVLISGAISRIPIDVIEYGKLEGVGIGREFFQIDIPMIWPTVVTLFMIGMTAPLTIYLQAYFLMGSNAKGPYNTATISLHIFGSYETTEKQPQLTAFGLFFSALYVPIILLTRKFMSRFFAEVDY